jgi:hypothetical protein
MSEHARCRGGRRGSCQAPHPHAPTPPLLPHLSHKVGVVRHDLGQHFWVAHTDSGVEDEWWETRHGRVAPAAGQVAGHGGGRVCTARAVSSLSAPSPRGLCFAGLDRTSETEAPAARRSAASRNARRKSLAHNAHPDRPRTRAMPRLSHFLGEPPPSASRCARAIQPCSPQGACPRRSTHPPGAGQQWRRVVTRPGTRCPAPRSGRGGDVAPTPAPPPAAPQQHRVYRHTDGSLQPTPPPADPVTQVNG